jgi:ketosteroid isomerase-like protein
MNMPKTHLQAVLLATPDDTEAQFYEALQHGDLERMMAVWLDDDEAACCIHPGSGRLSGKRAIRAAYEQLFSQGHGVDVRPMSVQRVTLPGGGTVLHHVVERVRVETAEGPRLIWVLATHLYLKTPEGWRLVVHHASPGTGREHHEGGESPSTLH